MAQVFPPDGPILNNSHYAEPLVYEKLKALSDEFIVIHSVSWLGDALSGLGRSVGEIDFVILHPELGILTLNVKGGILKHEKGRFINIRTGLPMYPVDQARDNAGGIYRWLKNATERKYHIGHAFVFPESEIDNRSLPPGLSKYYNGKQESICIGRSQLHSLPQRIIEVMQLWQTIQGTNALGKVEIERIRKLLSPDEDYAPRWMQRVAYDNETWLKLTDEQYAVTQAISRNTRSVIKGLAGTGKTVIAISYAHEQIVNHNRVLFLTFNKRLAAKIQREFKRYSESETHVTYFHDLCKTATQRLGKKVGNWESWLKDAPNYLKEAIHLQRLERYDTLVVDEGQVFAEEWLQELANWFADKSILVCADDSQVFPFERKTTTEAIAKIIEAPQPYLLTVNMRSPRRVFARLQPALQVPYQDISLRQDEVEALEEIATTSPNEALHEVLQRLTKEQIPPAYITVLYFMRPPEYEPNDRGIPGETLPVYQFRGLESPIVIVWADEVSSKFDSSLLCAYTRATSRCIVIYDAIQLSLADNESFSKKLVRVNTAPPTIVKEIDKYWPLSLSQKLVKLPIRTGDLYWSSNWSTWIDEEETRVDKIGTALWKDYLCLYSSNPVGVPRKLPALGHPEVTFIKRIETLNPKLYDYYYSETLLRCSNCERWTICRKNSSDEWECTECWNEDLCDIPFDEISEMKRFDDILFNWVSASANDKKGLPISLVALAYWRTLNRHQQVSLLDCGFTLDSYPAANAAAVMIAVHLAKLNIGDNVKLAELRNTFIEWFAKREHDIGHDEWTKVIGGRIPSWTTKNVLTKIASGEYIFNGFKKR